MLAYTYIEHGKFELREKPEPKITDARDAIVRVTLGSICTSDLHIKHGSVPRAVPGITVGHEMVGVVEEVFHCGTGISAVISIQIACLYSIRWRIFSIDFPDGMVKTVSVNWQPPFLAGIRIGQTCFTAGFSIWFLIGEGMIKNTRTVFRHCWSGRKGHENLPFAGV